MPTADGNTNKVFNSGARSADNVDAYLGKTYSLKIFSRAIVYGSNNNGFIQTGAPTVTLSIYGKNGRRATPPMALLLVRCFTETNNRAVT